MNPESHGPALRRYAVILAVLALAALAGVALLSYLQPLSADDIANTLNLHRTRTLAGFVGHYYNAWTGRATGISLLYIALQWRAAFAAANALAFVALAVLTFGVAAGRLPRTSLRDALLVTFTLATYWFAFPAIAETVFWVTGSVTYLWPAVLMLAVIYPYRRWIHAGTAVLSTWRAGLLALLMAMAGLAAGLSHELSFGVLLTLAALLVIVLARGGRLRQLPPWAWMGLLGLLVGGALLLLSPGNAARSGTSAELTTLAGSAFQYVMFVLKAFGSYLPKLYPWLLCLALLAVPLDTGTWRASLRQGDRWWLLWAVAALITLLPFALEPDIALMSGQRTTTFAAVLLTVSALSLAVRRDEGLLLHALPLKLATGVAAVLLAVMVVELGGSARVAQSLRTDLAQREREVAAQLAEGNRDVRVRPLPTTPYRTVYYVDIETDADYWLNRSVAEWYGVDSIVLDASPSSPLETPSD